MGQVTGSPWLATHSAKNATINQSAMLSLGDPFGGYRDAFEGASLQRDSTNVDETVSVKPIFRFAGDSDVVLVDFVRRGDSHDVWPTAPRPLDSKAIVVFARPDHNQVELTKTES